MTMILAHPELLAELREEFAAVEISGDALDKLRCAILDASVENSDLDSETLKRHLSDQGFASILGQLSAPLDWPRRRLGDRMGKPGGSLSELERGWRHVYSRHELLTSLMAEFKEALAAMGEDLTDETQARVDAIRRQLVEFAGEDEGFEPTLP